MKEESSARRILTKNYFPPIHVEVSNSYMIMNDQPKYYAGIKFKVYNKYLIIMSYTHAFYFEEAIFNLYLACKSFRNMLIKNYQIIE